MLAIASIPAFGDVVCHTGDSTVELLTELSNKINGCSGIACASAITVDDLDKVNRRVMCPQEQILFLDILLKVLLKSDVTNLLSQRMAVQFILTYGEKSPTRTVVDLSRIGRDVDDEIVLKYVIANLDKFVSKDMAPSVIDGALVTLRQIMNADSRATIRQLASMAFDRLQPLASAPDIKPVPPTPVPGPALPAEPTVGRRVGFAVAGVSLMVIGLGTAWLVATSPARDRRAVSGRTRRDRRR